MEEKHGKIEKKVRIYEIIEGEELQELKKHIKIVIFPFKIPSKSAFSKTFNGKIQKLLEEIQ